MIHIMVLEDDVKLNHSVSVFLRNHDYNVVACFNANEAFDALIDKTIDIIISDIMMPEMDGFEFAEQVREQDKEIPLLFLTARDDIFSKQKGFRLGVDDYLVKPADPDELLLRVKALLRRAKISTEKRLTVGDFVLDEEERTAYLGEEEIPLTIKEFNLIYKLLSYPKRSFTRHQLMDEFWGTETDSSPRSVDVYINKLRDKLAPCDGFEIVTIHGLGYKAVLK